MTAAAQEGLQAFTRKWRERWPEWALAEVFVPVPQRETAVAWFALLQEFSDAAWGGADPAPGLAKLAWWQEELRGWAKGARRHPLGEVLQARSSRWQTLADAMGLLRHRDLPADAASAIQALAPFNAAAAQVEADLFGGPVGDTAAGLALLVPAVTGQGDADNAAGLLQANDASHAAPRAVRLLRHVLRQRLQQAAEGAAGRSPSRWRTLWALWRAARSA